MEDLLKYVKMELTRRKLARVENDMFVALAMIEGSVSEEKKAELKDRLQKEDVVQFHNNLNRSSYILLDFALENELYEVCGLLDKNVLCKLNPDVLL